ncbi:hypothetical protein PPERSA_09472 [Pseudocohnilembus persalinus]|uniref:Transmembrane protein n=1 Tax=Pseudocohnilembus persalinus TaxID=266149 RepID=A0A0V0QRN4_PSEPJ|nr:hypothetical protein PPERSA_09472 [Pseudocohnilembus persalinus]|eukprot:KRX04680.1 hypothetical protein PPERSA_09472 [Pseudocohnilembus persalinus]
MRTNQNIRNNSEKNFPLPGTICLIALLLAFIKTSIDGIRKQGQKQKQSEDQNLGQSQSNRVRKISCSPSANVTNTYLQNHSQSFNYQTSRQSYTNFSQAKSQLNNISYVDQFNYTEKDSFKKFFENFNKMQPNLNQFNSYLKNEISVYRNKILERIYTQQRKNLHQIDDCLSQFNFNLMEFDMLNKALSEDGKFQQNYYMNPKNQQLRLDDILYDQTYLIQSLEKQIKNIGQLNQFNEKTLNDNLSQLMEYLYERKKYLDNQLVIFGYEENGRTQFRLHNIIRLGLISFNPSLYKYNDHLQLDLKITPPTDNQILISVVTHYFNGLINEIFQNLLASVTRQQRQFRSRAKYPIDKLDEALNSIKGHCVKYLPHHLCQQNQGSDAQSNQFQENRMIQDPIYFVQKNPAGSDLQMDVYSNKQRFVAIPGQYNLNCCLYYYSICVLEKLKFINQEYMNMGDDLRKIQEYNLFLSQIHEFSDKFSNYTSNVFKMN